MSVQAPPLWIERLIPGHIQQLIGQAQSMWMRERFVVTSWYRDPQRNAQVGGAEFSLHLIGLAFDAAPIDGGSVPDLEAAAYRSGFPQVVGYRTHVHVGLWKAGVLERLVRAAGG